MGKSTKVLAKRRESVGLTAVDLARKKPTPGLRQ